MSRLWIVDSGTTDHMIGVDFFLDYKPDSRNHNMMIADGSLSITLRSGSITIAHDFALKNVLYVPKLSHNLLSISRLTRDLKCLLISHRISVFFRAYSRNRIDSVEKYDCLYYFVEEVYESRHVRTASLLLNLIQNP